MLVKGESVQMATQPDDGAATDPNTEESKMAFEHSLIRVSKLDELDLSG